MGHIAVSRLAYAHPGGEPLFSDVTFRLAAGQHAALVGANGVGKTTLLRILAGALTPDAGEAAVGGRVGYMPQDVGVAGERRTVRELLLSLAPISVRRAGESVITAETELAAGDDEAGIRLGAAIADYASLGGYELEGQWDAACRRIVRRGFDELAERPAVTLSGGERKRLVLDVLFASDAELLLLDEPDNFLDVPAKVQLERQIRTSKKTVLLISHDREVLAGAVDVVVTLEGTGAWTYHGQYAGYAEARRERQQRLGDAVRRWHEEERRLRELMRTFKERARYSSAWAKKADAAETRWRRFSADGPPPPAVSDVVITVRLRGGDSARRALDLRAIEINGLVAPFSDEIHFGERVAVIGPNGSGKSELTRVLAGAREPDAGELVVGPRVSRGFFTQLQTRGDFAGRGVLDIVLGHVGAGGLQAAMGALARYGLADAARRSYEVLSGGEKARLEVLALELEGHNLLLLDEPTDNLDVDSCEALGAALERFEGTVVAVSHDRAFLRGMDRFLMVGHYGVVLSLPAYEAALAAILDPGLRRGAAAREGSVAMMPEDPYGLERFIRAQAGGVFEQALAELERGHKRGHWMWFVFPQLAGLGRSPTAQAYAIGSLEEARAYLDHAVLGARLRESSRALLDLSGVTAESVLGPVDAMKLRSSMTLFDRAAPGDEVFTAVIDRFYGGESDVRTLDLLDSRRSSTTTR